MIVPTVNNIKIHFRINSTYINNLLHKSTKLKLYSNYFVYRNKFTFIVFYSGFVNVTGVKRCVDIIKARNLFLFEVRYKNNFDDIGVVVDNITASGNLHNFIDLRKIRTKLESKLFRCRYRPEFFAGLFITSRNCRGTVILFHSGKYSIVGCRTKEEINLLCETILSAVI